MNLHTLSRLPDDLGGPLGPPIRREPEAPKPIRRPDGIVIAPDGKMSTDFPEPDANPVWPFPHTPAPTPADPPADEACGLQPQAGDVPEGAMWRDFRGDYWRRISGGVPECHAARLGLGRWFAAPASWAAVQGHIEPIAAAPPAADVAQPSEVPEGAMWRSLQCQDVFIRWDNCRAQFWCSRDPIWTNDFRWTRDEFEDRSKFEPIAQPLKVGDKVRRLNTGEVLTITRANNAGGCTTYYGGRSSGPICWADEEGKYWERA